MIKQKNNTLLLGIFIRSLIFFFFKIWNQMIFT